MTPQPSPRALAHVAKVAVTDIDDGVTDRFARHRVDVPASVVRRALVRETGTPVRRASRKVDPIPPRPRRHKPRVCLRPSRDRLTTYMPGSGATS